MLLEDPFAAKQFELLLEASTRKILGELAKLHEEIGALNEEVSALKRQQRTSAPSTPVYGAHPSGQNSSFGPQAYGPPQGYASQAPYPQQPQSYPQQPAQNPAFNQQPYAQGYPQQQAYPEPLPQAREPERPPVNRPIDRNGVAPSTVSIEKMFYCGNKK